MRTIEATPAESRSLNLAYKIPKLEWDATVDSVLNWLDSKPKTITTIQRTEMRAIITTPLTVTQIPVCVYSCYADIPPNYRWNTIFDIRHPETRQTTIAISCFGVYFRRAVMRSLDNGHHAQVILDFPEGPPQMLDSLSTGDDGNIYCLGTLGLCRSDDYPLLSHYLSQLQNRGINRVRVTVASDPPHTT